VSLTPRYTVTAANGARTLSERSANAARILYLAPPQKKKKMLRYKHSTTAQILSFFYFKKKAKAQNTKKKDFPSRVRGLTAAIDAPSLPTVSVFTEAPPATTRGDVSLVTDSFKAAVDLA
jgi:hypothetical protein